MKRIRTGRSVYTEVVTALFVWLFAYTAIMKWVNLPGFTANMEQVRFISPYAAFLSLAIPSIEVVTVLLLIIPRTRHAGLWVSTMLMGLFTAYTAVVLTGPGELPCSCGGVMKSLNWREHLLFNVAFLLAGVLAIVLQHKKIAINRSRRIPET